MFSTLLQLVAKRLLNYGHTGLKFLRQSVSRLHGRRNSYFVTVQMVELRQHSKV